MSRTIVVAGASLTNSDPDPEERLLVFSAAVSKLFIYSGGFSGLLLRLSGIRLSGKVPLSLLKYFIVLIYLYYSSHPLIDRHTYTYVFFYFRSLWKFELINYRGH